MGSALWGGGLPREGRLRLSPRTVKRIDARLCLQPHFNSIERICGWDGNEAMSDRRQLRLALFAMWQSRCAGC